MNSASIMERIHITPEQIYDDDYSDSGIDRDLVVELLVHVAGELRVPVGKMRPENRFSEPPRESRRLVGVSHAAMATCSV